MAARRSEAGGLERVRAHGTRSRSAARISNVDAVDASHASRSRGRFEPEHQFLLDNRSHAGQARLRSAHTFRARQRAARARESRLDSIHAVTAIDCRTCHSLATEPLRITGRIDELPAAGLASGRAPPRTGHSWPKLTSFPTHDRARVGARREDCASHPAARSRRAARLRARVVAARPGARAAFLIRHPVVGFCSRAARALLRPQFSQGVLMDESRRRGRQVLLILAAIFLLPVFVAFAAVLRQVVAAGRIGQQGRSSSNRRARCVWRASNRPTAVRPAPTCSPANGPSSTSVMAPAMPIAARRWCSRASRAWRSTTR